MGLTFVFFLTVITSCLANNNEWNSRTFETYFNRLGSRIDQLVVRMDHLDNRINRFTSLVQGRLDNIESSLATSKLKMGLWGEEMNRIEEQLTRKWKNIESKFDLVVPSVEAKLDSKITLIQRDNRRHNEHLSSLLAGLGQRLEKSNEKATSILTNLTNSERNSCPPASHPSDNKTFPRTEERLISMMEDFGNRSSEIFKSGSTFLLTSNKVTNMFEDLIRRTDTIQTGVKDAMNMVNSSRRELQDSFRAAALPSRRSTQSSGLMTSSETMSAVVVEALASVESMSTALGRRMLELKLSIEERFEMVSMTLNGFLESCIRIQDGAPLIEESIASVLEKILDAFDNNTRTSAEEFYYVRGKLDFLLNGTLMCSSSSNSTYDEYSGGHVPDQTSSLVEEQIPDGFTNSLHEKGRSLHDLRTAEIIKNSEDLTEEEKATLWDSLFPNQNVPDGRQR